MSIEGMSLEGLIEALARRWAMELERTLEGVANPRAALMLYQSGRADLHARIEKVVGTEMGRLLQSHPAFSDPAKFAEAFVGLIQESQSRRGK